MNALDGCFRITWVMPSVCTHITSNILNNFYYITCTAVSCLGVDSAGQIETECGCPTPKIKYDDCITETIRCPPSSQEPTGYTLVITWLSLVL